jgi:asparagine synthase (glutamine-hydrolysing)
MCGIAGFVSTQAAGGASILARMTAVIAHRGPDGAGHYERHPVYLGHRRLSIVDLEGGAQPMFNEDRTRAIVYNGEIFNHADLRPALERAGHKYSSHCDTETILHAYEEYGPACVHSFRGMFAFAIWDEDSNTLFCARDRLGIKPFYYYWDGTLFAFASEIKALLEHPSVSARLDEDQIPECLAFGYTSGGATLFRGIRKLMPGHHLTLSIAGPAPRLKIERYWDVPSPGDKPSFDLPCSDQDWIRETRRRLQETVLMRLMSDVPLGMFLSGGVDSSAIAALICRHAGGPVKTFAVGYREQRFSELSYAARVASPSAPSTTKSFSAARSSSTPCPVSCGTRTSPSHGPPASRWLSSAPWPRARSRSCSPAKAATNFSAATSATAGICAINAPPHSTGSCPPASAPPSAPVSLRPPSFPEISAGASPTPLWAGI